MYEVSNAYKNKMLDQVQTHRLRGTVDDIEFTDSDVIGVSWKNQCTAKNVNIGGVYIGTLKLTFLKNILERGSYMEKTITLSDGLITSYDDNEEPVWEDVPLGEFYIADAVWTSADMIAITAYDCLSKMDGPLQLDQSSGTIFSWCSYIATQTGTVFGLTQEECELLPNGTENLSPNEDNNLETWRDLLSALVQMIGGFAYAGKDGKWYIKTFEDNSILTIPKNRRVSGARFSDYTTLYDTISFVDAEKFDRVVGDANGLIMKLGNNPFLQTGSASAVERRAEAIVSSIKDMEYTPYDVSFLPAFIALDLGDVISFPDDYAEDTTTGASMMMTWTYNKSVKISCYGDNPNLRSAQSTTDKNIAGISKATVENEVTYYNYSNIEPITFGSEDETSIAKLRFTSAQKTTVKILHEFIFDMLSDLALDGSYELRYYLDDELLPYSPYERVGAVSGLIQGNPTDLSITRDFFYILKDVEPNIPHTWEVKIIAHGIDSITVDVDHAHVTLEGQRMYAETYFDGLIEAEDILNITPLGHLSAVAMTDSVLVKLADAAIAIGQDDIPIYDLSHLRAKPMTDSVQIFMEGGLYLITEDGRYITTEDGRRLKTEE